MEEVDAAYMKTCLYHKTLHPLCPVFKLGHMVQESGQNFSTLAEKVWCQPSGEGWAPRSSAQKDFSGPVNPRTAPSP